MNVVATAITLALLAAPVASVDARVQKGLKWLAAQQKADGTWESMNGFAPTSTTTTAALALLMEGSTPKDGVYAPHIRKTMAWLEANTSEKGQLASASPNEMYQRIPSHAHALLFLACAHDADDDTERRARIAKVIQKATTFLIEGQTSRGGWGFVVARDGNDYDDCQNTATALQALLAARKAGIDVPKKVTDRAVHYLAKATNNEGGLIYTISGGAVPMGNDGQPVLGSMAATAVLMQDGTRSDLLAKWVKNANATNPQLQYLRNGGVSALMHQSQFARMAFALGENGHRKIDPGISDGNRLRWSVYRAQLFKTLKEFQDKDGSWPDINFGPVYSTSHALIVLQLDNGYVPAFAR